MRDASLIRYDLHRHEASRPQFNPAAPFGSYHKALEKFNARRDKLAADLRIANRRELKRLARTLTMKADVYGPNGRIYSCDGKWSVREAADRSAYLFFNEDLMDPEQLCDGHGRTITFDSKY